EAPRALRPPELGGRALADAERVGLSPCRGHVIPSIFRREFLGCEESATAGRQPRACASSPAAQCRFELSSIPSAATTDSTIPARRDQGRSISAEYTLDAARTCLVTPDSFRFGQQYCGRALARLRLTRRRHPKRKGNGGMPSATTPDTLIRQTVAAMRTLAGAHPGFRPVHAKGLICSGTFRGARIGPSSSWDDSMSRASRR